MKNRKRSSKRKNGRVRRPDLSVRISAISLGGFVVPPKNPDDMPTFCEQFGSEGDTDAAVADFIDRQLYPDQFPPHHRCEPGRCCGCGKSMGGKG